jgi:glycosyltransferase involved in cell wall biosynthesis
VTRPNRGPRLLLVSMYPLDQGRWGPTVRIANLRDELGDRVSLDVVSGYRGARRMALARYAFSGRLRGLAGIYVESSSFLPSETDIAFLALARALGIPVLTYVRDAYQLFPEYYAASSIRRRIGAALFRPAFRALAAVSTRLAFPSAGLAAAVGADPARILRLPPGSPAPVDVPARDGANRLLFVGNGRDAIQGGPRLLRAIELARASGTPVELTVVSRPGEEPPGPHPPWLRLVRAEGDDIVQLLPDVIATVIPRPRSPYNDLAVPIKLYDYLAFFRPLLVTDCIEQAAVVRAADAGLVVGDDPEAIADGVRRLVDAGPAGRQPWADNAARAAAAQSWSARADEILGALGMPPPAPG